jgi:hypothetical protein
MPLKKYNRKGGPSINGITPGGKQSRSFSKVGKTFSNLKSKATKSKEKFTNFGIPEKLYDANDRPINTRDVDEGELSKIKTEYGKIPLRNRKYVSTSSDSAYPNERLYLKPKKK